MPQPEGTPEGGTPCWGAGFLPTKHQGVALRSVGDPVLYGDASEEEILNHLGLEHASIVVITFAGVSVALRGAPAQRSVPMRALVAVALVLTAACGLTRSPSESPCARSTLPG